MMETSFWHHHGILFLLAATFFPRLTLLLATPVHLGALGWLGWIFAPHLLVAIIATDAYWHTDPVLCILAWFVALGGTAGEAKGTHRITRGRRRRAKD